MHTRLSAWEQIHHGSNACCKCDSFDSEVQLTCDVISEQSPLKIWQTETLRLSLK